jgi:hypothetical protein
MASHRNHLMRRSADGTFLVDDWPLADASASHTNDTRDVMTSPLYPHEEASTDVRLVDDFKEGLDLTHTWELTRIALFTLLDGGGPPSGKGLVNLGGRYQFPRSFVGGPTLFGQGAEMDVRKFEVQSRAQADGFSRTSATPWPEPTHTPSTP